METEQIQCYKNYMKWTQTLYLHTCKYFKLHNVTKADTFIDADYCGMFAFLITLPGYMNEIKCTALPMEI